MKTISIVRHAKSSWDYPELSDFDRPLRNKGVKRTQKVCRVISQIDLLAPQILSSKAERAMKTAELLCSNLGWNLDIVRGVNEFYPGDVLSFIAQIKMVDNNISHLMVVGHNPGVTDLLNQLVINKVIDWIPTSGFAVLSCEIEDWSEIEVNAWELIRYIEPKQIINID